MEYAEVTFTAFLSAAIVSTLLTTAYLYQFWHHQRGSAFAVAAGINTLHLAAIALSFSHYQLNTDWLLFLECLHYNVWVLAIALSLRKHSKQQQFPRSLQILFGAGWPLTGLILLFALLDNNAILALTPWFALGLAVISLVSVEQLYRYAASNDRQIKLLCMNLGAIFLYDIYLYTHGLIFQGIDPLLWQSRAAVSIATHYWQNPLM